MKKILVFSHNPFSNILNNGKTLKNIFSMFEKDQLSQFYIDQNYKPDFSICENYFTISDKDIIKSFFNKRSDIGSIITGNQESELNEFKYKKTKIVFKIVLTKIIRNFIWEHSNWHSDKFQNWLNLNKPEILFFVGGSYTFSHNIAIKLSKYYKMKLVTYFTDDYIINNNSNSLLGRLYKRILFKSYLNTISNSNLLFAIGEIMARDYTVLFNKKFDHIMNCVDDQPSIIDKSENFFNISYFGGLHLKRYESLLEFAEIIKKLDLKHSYSISVYTATILPAKILNQLKDRGVKFHNVIEGEELKNAIYNSNFLLHLESYDSKIRNLIYYSISTKIPEYLISSRMLICYGPSDVASMKIIEENSLGLVIDKKNKDFQKKICVLKEYLNDSNKSKEVAKKGYLYAKENYTKDKIAKKFYSKINSL